MPEINGLQLVAAMREKYPRIPVILMTSQGSEEIAVQALQQGAASYVPKKLLLRYLWETIAKVLKAAVEDRSQARLLQCMLRTESIFHLENDPALFEPLVRYLQEETIRLGVCAEADRVRVGIALEEALANALYHGNLDVSSELRGTSGYYGLIHTRRIPAALPGAANRSRGPHHAIRGGLHHSRRRQRLRSQRLARSDRSSQHREGQRPRHLPHAGLHGRSPVQRDRQLRGLGETPQVGQESSRCFSGRCPRARGQRGTC